MDAAFDPSPANGNELLVFVVAQSPALRAGLRALLAGEDGLVVAGEGNALAAVGETEQFDVLLADIGEDDLPDGPDDPEFPALPAVVLGDWDEEDFAAPPSQPRGFLSREATGAEIASAIRAVAAGLTVFEPALAAKLVHSHADTSTGPAVLDSVLTEREHEVLELLALGLPNKSIARQLGISDHTAKFHVGTILSKLGAASRTEAVMLAARRGLLPL